MKLKSLLLSSLMLLSAGTAWADVEINETNFPDENFRNYLLEQDYGSDGVLTNAEIAKVTSMDVYSKSIQSLQGIEYFTALTYLDCGYNQLTALDVSKNTALTELGCHHNQLTSLDVSGCTALTYLNCSENQLTSFDVSKNTQLTKLRCPGNRLTSLDVSKNTALTMLYCDSNQLTSLDISKNTALTYLDCGYNQLSSLDVSKNTALTWLNCNSNQLTSLDVSKNTALTMLSCNKNQLTSLDVSKNASLRDLGCVFNQLTSLDVSKNTALTELGCGYNPLTSLDVSKNTALTELVCFSNQLTSLDVSKNTALISLYCYQNQIKGAGMDALVASLSSVNNGKLRIIDNTNEQNVMTTTQVDVAKAKGWSVYSYDGNDWVDYNGVLEINEANFPDENFRNWLLSRSYGRDGVLTDEEIAGMTSIFVSSNSIQSLKGIEYFTALTELYCDNNQLVSLDVSKNMALTRLRCYSNQLASLDVSKNTKLTELWCYSNQLTSFDVSGCTALTELMCDNNQLTSLDVSGCVALKHLTCIDNQLVSLNVSKNTALEKFTCPSNQLTSLDVSGCIMLTELRCYNNQLTSLDLSKNTALATLYCSSNQLTSLDVSKNTALTDLYCYNNQLTSLDVSKNTALTHLACYQNKIKGEGMDAFVESLPTVSNLGLEIVYNSNEQNEMTTAQVAAAKAKGWIPKAYTGPKRWVNYVGVKPLPPMPDLSPEELLKVNMSSSDMSSWFIDKETQIKGSFVQVTKNISDTEYKTGSIQTADGKTHPYSYFYVPEFNPFSNPNVAFYLPYNLKGEYDIYLVTMPTWTYQNNFDEEKHRYRFKASIWEKDEQNNFPSTGTALTVDDVNTFETPEVDANVITDTTFIGTYDFQHAYTDDNTPGVILQINPNVLSSQRKTYSNSMIFAGVVLVSKEYVTKVETVETSETDDSAPWYTINGTLLTEKPTAAGIYIHGGKKVIVK